MAETSNSIEFKNTAKQVLETTTSLTDKLGKEKEKFIKWELSPLKFLNIFFDEVENFFTKHDSSLLSIKGSFQKISGDPELDKLKNAITSAIDKAFKEVSFLKTKLSNKLNGIGDDGKEAPKPNFIERWVISNYLEKTDTVLTKLSQYK